MATCPADHRSVCLRQKYIYSITDFKIWTRPASLTILQGDRNSGIFMPSTVIKIRC